MVMFIYMYLSLSLYIYIYIYIYISEVLSALRLAVGNNGVGTTSKCLP